MMGTQIYNTSQEKATSEGPTENFEPSSDDIIDVDSTATL
jgi:hypothetical protein